MQSPKVSFVIPTYNCAAWLAHAIQSVIQCEYPNTEIVVIDDCSTDSTPILINHFLKENKANIVYRRNAMNMGRSASRNLGNDVASGEYIFVLDADDLAYPNRVKTTLERLKKADFVYGAADVIDAVGQITGLNQADSFDFERVKKYLFNFITHSTCAYTKALANEVKYRGGEIADLGLDDWAFELDCYSLGYRMDFTPLKVGAYREVKTGISKIRDKEAVKKAKLAFLEGMKVKANA